MTRLIITAILILGIGVLQAQEKVHLRIDADFETVRAEIPSAEHKKLDNKNVLIQDAGYAHIYYFFDTKDICVLQAYVYSITAMPKLLKALNNDSKFIKINNLEYIYCHSGEMRSYKLDLDHEEETVTLFVENI
jgi:hypothetical protein